MLCHNINFTREVTTFTLCHVIKGKFLSQSKYYTTKFKTCEHFRLLKFQDIQYKDSSLKTNEDITCQVGTNKSSYSPSGLGGGGLGGLPRGSGGPKEGAPSSSPLRERECA